MNNLLTQQAISYVKTAIEDGKPVALSGNDADTTVTIPMRMGDYVKLIKLAHLMNTQSNRATQFPLFAIQTEVKAYGDESWCNEAERKEDHDGELLCDGCKKKIDQNEELPEYCSNCDPECFVWFNWEKRFDLTAGVFLTEEACENHIKQNYYHYHKPMSYVICAWRNPEMQMLFQLIFSLAGKEAPSWYK